MSLPAKQTTWYHILHHLSTHNIENLKSNQLLKGAAVYNTVNFVDILWPCGELLCLWIRPAS